MENFKSKYFVICFSRLGIEHGGIHNECYCSLFCGSPMPCLTYFAVVVFDRPCLVGILNRICAGSAEEFKVA